MSTTTKAAHTPWHYVEIGETGEINGLPSIPVFDIVGDASPHRIVTVAGEDRARLISAAPEMLEALEICKRALFNDYTAAQLDGETLGSKAWAMAEAALQKAKGSQ